MAYVLVNQDGSSDAKVGDIVVTGGGLYEKTASGSVKVGELPGGNTGSYQDVKDAFFKMTMPSGSGTSKAVEKIAGSVAAGNAISSRDQIPAAVDANGLVNVGFDPAAFMQQVSTESGIDKKTLLYIGIGFAAIIVLDKVLR